MKPSVEEAVRLHQLVQAQGIEFELDEVEKLDGNRVLLNLRGIVKDDPDFKTEAPVTIADQLQKGDKVKAQIEVPLLPDDVYQLPTEKQDYTERTLQETSYVFKMDHLEYPEEGGILLYVKGWDDDPKFGIEGGKHNPLKYPRKGFPHPDALSACNLAKRVLICQIKYFARHPWSALPLLSKKGLDKWLDENGRIFGSILSPFYMKEERYMKCCRALRKFIFVFLKELGVRPTISETIAEAISTMIENDTAYSYRVRDLASVTTAELLLKNPRKEFRRIFEALLDRDPTRKELQGKVKAVLTLAGLAMLVPKYRRAFKRAIESIDFTMMQADEADRYHMLTMIGYKFGGIPDGQRLMEYLRIHDNRPPMGLNVGNSTIVKRIHAS